MLDFIVVPLVVGMITLGIYKFFELIICRRERLNIIEKLDPGELIDYLKNRVFRRWRCAWGVCCWASVPDCFSATGTWATARETIMPRGRFMAVRCSVSAAWD